MTFRPITCLSLLLSVLCCCTHDEASLTPTDYTATVCLSVTLVTPTAGVTRSLTRADDAPDTEPGTAAESHISSALVVLANLPAGATFPTNIHSVCLIDRLYPLFDGQRWTGELQVAPGSYRLLVVANPTARITAQLQAAVGKPWHEVIATTVSETSLTDLAELWQNDSFVMTNAYSGHTTECDVTLHPAVSYHHVVIPVQRACARFDYLSAVTDNCYSLSAETTVDGAKATIDVTLKQAALMNISPGYHLFKHFSADDKGLVTTPYAVETADNYVLDTDWPAKRTAAPQQSAALFFASSEAGQALTYRELPVSTTDYSTLFYASENTLPGVARQINCLSTAVVFAGSFTVSGITATDLYCLESKQPHALYTSLSNLKEAHTDLTVADGATDAQLAAAGICRYRVATDGTYPVWYTYWNRHNDNQNPILMGVMEFAVVRNHVYKLRVNRISSLGLPKDPVASDNPWKPAGTTPDELGAQLDVTVSVADWTNRFYDYDI